MLKYVMPSFIFFAPEFLPYIVQAFQKEYVFFVIAEVPFGKFCYDWNHIYICCPLSFIWYIFVDDFMN